MTNSLTELAERKSVKSAIKANWEAYHYCLAQSPNVELTIGRYLTWLMTNLPDHFMNLVVCSQLPPDGVDDLAASVLVHFRSMNIRKLSWLTHENVPSAVINKVLLVHGLTFRGAFATEMAVDLSLLPDGLPIHPGLRIVAVDGEHLLKQWIHVASVGFRVDQSFEKVWFDFLQMRFLTGGFKPIWPCWMEGQLPHRNYSSPIV